MTIVTTATSSGPYTATADDTFAVTFQSAGDDEIEVTLDGGVVSPSLYTFTRDDDGTGEVVFDDPVTGEVWIFSAPDFGQPTEFQRFGAFFPDMINGPLDRVTAGILWLRERVSLLFPDVARIPADRAGQFVAFDADGDPVLSSGTGADDGLRTDLAATTGDTLLGIDDDAGGSLATWRYDHTTANGKSLMRWIAPAQRAAIIAGTSTYNATADVLEAFAEGVPLVAPAGLFNIDNLDVLGAAGRKLVGASRFNTIFKARATTTGSLFYYSGGSTSYGHLFADFHIDLNSRNVVGIDLSKNNNCLVERVRIVGGPNKAGATGTGVKFAAPSGVGSYTNTVLGCDGTYLDTGVLCTTAANEQMIYACEWLAGNIGIDISSGVTKIEVKGGRCEGNNIGIRDGGAHTTVTSYFEAQTTADVSFVAGAAMCSYSDCHTATTATPVIGLANTTGVKIDGGNLDQRRLEPSVSNTLIQAGRQTFAAAGSAAAIAANPSIAVPGVSTYAGYFYDPLFIRNAVGIEAINATNDNTVLILSVDASNRVNLAGFDRKSGTYTRLYVGEHFSFLNTGLQYDGTKVLGAQGAAVADATDAASAITQLNALLARMRAHGLIAT